MLPLPAFTDDVDNEPLVELNTSAGQYAEPPNVGGALAIGRNISLSLGCPSAFATAPLATSTSPLSPPMVSHSLPHSIGTYIDLAPGASNGPPPGLWSPTTARSPDGSHQVSPPSSFTPSLEQSYVYPVYHSPQSSLGPGYPLSPPPGGVGEVYRPVFQPIQVPLISSYQLPTHGPFTTEPREPSIFTTRSIPAPDTSLSATALENVVSSPDSSCIRLPPVSCPFIVFGSPAEAQQVISTRSGEKRSSGRNQGGASRIPPELQSKEAVECKRQSMAKRGPAAASECLAMILPYILDAIHSPFANNLVQDVVKLIPEEAVPPIIEAVSADEKTFLSALRGRYSCWVLQTVFTGGYIPHPRFEACVVRHARELSCHSSGNFVIQKALNCGHFKSYPELMYAILEDFRRIAMDKCGSHVAEAIITSSHDRGQAGSVIVWIMAQPYFTNLVCDQHACFVVERVAETAQEPMRSFCLRLIRHVIRKVTPQLLEGDDEEASQTASVLNSVRLKCRLINKNFDTLTPMSQQDFIAHLIERNLMSPRGEILI
ncbi:hypothetical protein GMRT_10804 [Giardia muris]|uniref:PUM-HD domain-containing protein n=1 Tax=Giardia muris TaxID=5742 RepID=A0A4Z1T4X7_GIAMU|nr:hypothetical protein GMRT_10804 [Giardia muris]|eukprot:TNJ27501.1 hypothetical protein GMRT_10804 [Giardia muris]